MTLRPVHQRNVVPGVRDPVDFRASRFTSRGLADRASALAEFARPRVDCGALLSIHLPKQYAHAEDSRAATGKHVDHFAVQFVCAHSIADAEK